MRYILCLLLFLSSAAYAQEEHNSQSFSDWIKDFRDDARGQGISDSTLDDAFTAIDEPNDRIIELDRKQPESTITLSQYLAGAVSDKRVKEGRERLAENRTLLHKVSKQFGVPPQYIVALWGIETNYGKNQGSFDIFDSLATLAYDGRRSDYFRDELIKALKIMQKEGFSPGEMQSSWAGAMGQCQFMPTSFLQYAYDYDNDGRHDIWNSEADVFASIANYLKSSGWDDSYGWGVPIDLPEGYELKHEDIKTEKTVAEWKKLGIKAVDGSQLPEDHVVTSLALVNDQGDAVPYIITGNYKVLMKWNRSRLFATAVGTLADSIK